MKILKTGVLCLSPLVHITGDMHKNKVIEKIDRGGILYLRPRRHFSSLRHWPPPKKYTVQNYRLSVVYTPCPNKNVATLR